MFWYFEFPPGLCSLMLNGIWHNTSLVPILRTLFPNPQVETIHNPNTLFLFPSYPPPFARYPPPPDIVYMRNYLPFL